MEDNVMYKEEGKGYGMYKRIFDKNAKGWLIVYDTRSLPDGLKVKEAENVEKGEIYWDSSKGGMAPQIVHLGGDKFKERQNYKIVDLANKPNE